MFISKPVGLYLAKNMNMMTQIGNHLRIGLMKSKTLEAQAPKVNMDISRTKNQRATIELNLPRANMKWRRDETIPYSYRRGDELLRVVAKPFSVGLYTIMHRAKIGDAPSYYGVYRTPKDARKDIKDMVKVR